ncbi:MAG: SsrA-binding protein SmpB [Lachnospiraceae bacterium]|jgi:SsrA-binding protein|nr:SsrA-binding protein SmpB [Lachnospiraceae bacterium]MCH4030546.1 SsrA-binding protein SmpB [Lachnospiraceae bacterium]MCH4069755.1 SsrA-binding protein SmpB [Lachnospiraceae bacterium]MCH4107306.1 SsrA-binding protein SmpB [Lachnospiraceae bacterium]MCI1301839.1 SsrA-binding protein SmpB [Lachnospiraceae bacterium]
MAGRETGEKILANNKKAFFDYFIEEQLEAGIELAGTEVKSIRQGKVSIKKSYIRIENRQVYIIGMNVTPYEKGNIFNRDPLRVRRLLLHRDQINKLEASVSRSGYTLVPLNVHLTRGRVKVQIGLGKGKKNYDKRESIAKRDQQRAVEREFRMRIK